MQHGINTILGSRPSPQDPSSIRTKFGKATKAARNKTFGAGIGLSTSRSVFAVVVITPRGNCHAAYLPQRIENGEDAFIYVATKSNDPVNPIYCVLPEDLLHDAVVVVPKDDFTDTDLASLKAIGYIVFDSFTKTAHAGALASVIPSTADPDDEYFIVIGPKCMPLVYGDLGFHGEADDSAVGVLEASQGRPATKIFFAMWTHFSLSNQTWLVANSATVPDNVFKKPHPSRPLALATFTVSVGGPDEDIGAAELAALTMEVNAHRPLQPIPRKPGGPPPVIGGGGLGFHDDDTLASDKGGAPTERETRVLLNLSKAFTFTLFSYTHSINTSLTSLHKFPSQSLPTKRTSPVRPSSRISALAS